MPKLKPKDQSQFYSEENQLNPTEGELVADVFETEKEFVVMTAIAGIQIKDIDITLEKDMLIIKGTRENPFPIQNRKYFFQECHWGPFSKKIILPENLNIDKADAQMDKGILTIRIPKIEGAKGKLDIKIS